MTIGWRPGAGRWTIIWTAPDCADELLSQLRDWPLTLACVKRGPTGARRETARGPVELEHAALLTAWRKASGL